MAGETLLVISPIGVQPFSARGLTQTLDPIAASVMQKRTVNGVLTNIAPPQFKKYKSKISCTDILAPAIDGVFPGMIVTVSCVAELSYLTIGGTPQRPVVAGSSRVEGDFTYYRPQLTMMVQPFTESGEEYEDKVAWSLDLEEV